jgi:hypothetical protein
VPDAEGGRPRRRIVGWIGAVSALVLAAITTIGTGLGSAVVGIFNDESPAAKHEALVSASARETIVQCGTKLFVGRGRLDRVLRTKPSRSWTRFMRVNDARVADQSVVLVSIQGESARTITLTGIRFDVKRRPQPAGAVFVNPCGDNIDGRSLQADLDRAPVAITKSNADPRGVLDPSQRPARPLRFPWTVSVTDPLLLTIVAATKRCSCTWRAAID